MKKIIKFFKKPFCFAICYTVVLVILITAISLHAFVVPQATVPVDYPGIQNPSQTFLDKKSAADGLDENGYGYWEQQDVINTDGSATETYTARGYTDENIRIEIRQYRRLATDIYVADIQIRDVEYLKAAFAKDTYGVHITQNTSEIAREHQAILAINGDYFGYHTESFVLRNGVTYRESARTDAVYDNLIIGYDGSFSTVIEEPGGMEELKDNWQVFGFGPTLLWDGQIVTGETTEVARCKASNPRTAIGRFETGEDGWLHYCFVTSDGRTERSAGLTLYQLAGFLQEIGCVDGYNMDGGGSTTMVFNNEVVNLPTNGNYGIKERGVSDIVYIGY